MAIFFKLVTYWNFAFVYWVTGLHYKQYLKIMDEQNQGLDTSRMTTPEKLSTHRSLNLTYIVTCMGVAIVQLLVGFIFSMNTDDESEYAEIDYWLGDIRDFVVFGLIVLILRIF